MPVHARQLIRAAIIAALTNTTAAGARVYDDDAAAIDPKVLEAGPALVVWFRDDTATKRDKEKTLTRSITLQVSNYALSMVDLETLNAEVEAIIHGSIWSTDLDAPTTTFKSGREAERPYLAAQLQWDGLELVTAYLDPYTPETPVP